MTLGEKIKKLRGEKNLTQADLAEKVHVTFQTVSKWEKDENEPDVSTLRELAKIFSCSIDYLLSESEEENKESKDVEVVAIPVPVKKEVTAEAEDGGTKPTICHICKKEIPDDQLEIGQICIKPGRAPHRGHPGRAGVYRTVCYHKECIAKQREEQAKQRKASEKKEGKKGAAKSFGWGIAAGIVALLVSLFIWLNNPEYVSTGGAIGISIASGYGIFAMIYCIVSGSYIGEVFVWAAGLSVKFPGIIFSFDLDGLAFLIGMKILFAILGFLIGVAAFIFAVLLCAALSVVSFPFILIHNIRNNYDEVL